MATIELIEGRVELIQMTSRIEKGRFF